MHLGRRIVETPGLTGSSLLEARREADRYGLMVLVTSGSPRWTAELSARLRVVAQTPRTGTLVRRRCVICLVVDGGAGDRAALGIGGPGPYEDAVELAPRPQRWGLRASLTWWLPLTTGEGSEGTSSQRGRPACKFCDRLR